MLNTNLGTVLERLNQYNNKIEQDINKYINNRKIKIIDYHIDKSTLFKDLFSEDEEAVKGRLNLIQKINNQKIENLDNIQDQLFNEIKYSMYSSHMFFYYTVLKNFEITPTTKVSYQNDIFSYTQNNTRYVFNSKKGISFGTHLSIGTLADPSENLQFNEHTSYFLKSCRGYLILNSKSIGTTENQFSSTSVFGSPGKQPRLAPDINNMDIDFKELFVYKCLQYLNFGAEISFFINPYLKKALYIQSKDLNSEEKIVKYQTAQSLEERQIRNQEVQFEIQLTEMDIIARSFLLTDMHNENIMFRKADQEGFDLKIVDFIVPNEDVIKSKSEEGISLLKQAIKLQNESITRYREWLSKSNFPNNKESIADANKFFIEPTINIIKNLQKRLKECRSNLYILDNISTSFITANTLTKYSQEEGRNTIISETLKKEDNITGRNQKRLAGEEALELLEKRLNTVGNRPGIGDGLARIMQQAERDIESFMQEENQIIPQSNSSLLGLTNDQFEEKIEDLHKYQTGVLINLGNIMKFIESGEEIEDDQQVL